MKYPSQSIAGMFLFLAAFQFVLMLLVSETLYPGYSVSENYISDLGVGPSAMLFNASVFLLGLLMLLGAYLLQRVFNDKVFSCILILNAVGSLIVGVFPENLEPMHSTGAFLIFSFGALTTLYSIRLTKRPFAYLSVLLGVLSLLAFALFALQQYAGLGVGGMERMIVYPNLVWMVGFAGYLLGSSEKP